ncbi:MAG TPA: VTT domain-containing protein [Candidatus Paceibacterota bacterium]
MRPFPYKQIAYPIVLALVFLAVSYLAQRYHGELAFVVSRGGVFGVIGFVLLTALFVIFVIPLDIAFLIPIGASVFGSVPTALMSITGWTLGAAVAFGIARRFGRPVVERIIGSGRLAAVEQRIPKRDLFWSVVVLRMLMPVDLLSYALGLVSSLSWGRYVLATALGVAPFGFFFAYAGVLPFLYRVVSIGVALVLAVVLFLTYGRVRKP